MYRFCVFVKEEREKQGLSMYALAKKAGVSRVNIREIEKNGRIPHVYIANRLCLALGKKYILGE